MKPKDEFFVLQKRRCISHQNGFKHPSHCVCHGSGYVFENVPLLDAFKALEINLTHHLPAPAKEVDRGK